MPDVSATGRSRSVQSILQRTFWVFDLDGTLTVPVHDFALIRAELGVPEGSDILGHLDAPPREEGALLHQRLHDMERRLIAATAPATGAHQLVTSLAEVGCRLGILTRNSREIAAATLAWIGLEAYFPSEAILGRFEAAPKPDPDGIRQLADLWGTAPSEMVMVGDYLYDLQAGQIAGAGTIHVHGTLERRWPEWTDLCVPSLQELAARVEACRSTDFSGAS